LWDCFKILVTQGRPSHSYWKSLLNNSSNVILNHHIEVIGRCLHLWYFHGWILSLCLSPPIGIEQRACMQLGDFFRVTHHQQYQEKQGLGSAIDAWWL
jgi:hypothetical protein